jgi:hypothetical protein
MQNMKAICQGTLKIFGVVNKLKHLLHFLSGKGAIIITKCLIELSALVYRLGSCLLRSMQNMKEICQGTLKIFGVVRKLLTFACSH